MVNSLGRRQFLGMSATSLVVAVCASNRETASALPREHAAGATKVSFVPPLGLTLSSVAAFARHPKLRDAFESKELVTVDGA